MVGKVSEKLVYSRIVDHLEKCGVFLIFIMVLGLVSQLEIFSQLYLIELLGLLIGMGLLELWHLIYLGLLTGFGMLVFFTNLSLMEVLQIFHLIFSFLSNKHFKLVLDEKFSQKYPVKAGDP